MNRRNSFSWLATIINVGGLLTICILSFFVGDILLGLPQKANDLYGPPTSQLSTFQKWHLSRTLVWNYARFQTPFDPSGLEQDFVIEFGESTQSVISKLTQQGLILHPELLRDYLIYTGFDRQLQAGEYKLSPAMSGIEIAQSLLDATPTAVQARIALGTTRSKRGGHQDELAATLILQSYLDTHNLDE